VAVGVIPTILGGPVFAIMLSILFLIGYREYLTLAALIGTRPIASGYLVLPFFAALPFFGLSAIGILGICAIAVALPLSVALRRASYQEDGLLIDWALSVAGTLYLGIPLASGVATRIEPGQLTNQWLSDIAATASLDWGAAPRGLAWMLTFILVTWLGDTGAFLIGRRWGKHLLLPTISPKKTVEGAVGGMIASALTAAIAVAAFGLGISPVIGAAIGAILGVLGQIGDLTESLMKRQAGVKDSGTFIRGHGGVLDRIDALLVVLAAGWYVSLAIDRWQT
jgi:phosphatidate cytidylyltransferase